MRMPLSLFLIAPLGLAAQTAPAVKWRGALGVSAAASDRQTVDDGLFLRPMDAGEGKLALDALQLGADVDLKGGWSLKVTLLAGQTAKVLNASTLYNGQPVNSGDLAWPEAVLAWTGGADTFKAGRMYTPLGMEVLDPTQDVAASRGLLFSYAIPFAQLGLAWHHGFSASWSADLWLFNGEDRLQDNNRGKTVGLGVTYNHAGAADKYVSLMAFSGPEQDGTLAAVNTGAEGRKRQRLSMTGQWVWGKATLQWEADHATERFEGLGSAAWNGAGAILSYAFSDRWSGYVRAEWLKDDAGVRLGADPSVAAVYAPARDLGLAATSASLGIQRRWQAVFTRFEVRRDRLDKEVREGAAGGHRPFQDATSATWSLGASF